MIVYRIAMNDFILIKSVLFADIVLNKDCYQYV
jgi:hypothetical protein